MTNDQIVAKLRRTLQSINSHLDRGMGLGYNGNINRRGCELKDRYDDLRAVLMEYGGHRNPVWQAYCDSVGACYTHTGYDNFC